MGLIDRIFGERKDGELNKQDEVYLKAEPISRKLMDLLWLDPQTLELLSNNNISQYIAVSDDSEIRNHEYTPEDIQFAKKVEVIIDKAYEAGQRNNLKDSIFFYKQALDLAPGCDLFLMSIGSLYACLGQKAKALKYLERAAQISPDNKRIKDNLAYVRRM